MRCLFVANQRKTSFFDPVARALERRGATVFWISPSRRWTRFLVEERGWDSARVLDLPAFGPEWSSGREPSAEEWRLLTRIEAGSEIAFRNSLLMDRELARAVGPAVELYLAVVTREIDRFVRENGIGFGFGEPTWSHERVAAEVLRAAGGAYFMPTTLRVPSNRSAFFRGILHDEVAPLRPSRPEDRALARAAMTALRERGEKPDYFYRNMNPTRFRGHWWEEARQALARPADRAFDHSVPGLGLRAARRLRARAQHRLATLGGGLFEQGLPASGRPFALVTLHKQPEASVDVFGNAMNNQLEVIRALARILPADWELWVKEHPNAIGDRSPSTYRDLRAIPGLRLIHPGQDTLTLARRAGLVASVSGTACLEAGILGVPAVTFAPMFFRPLLLRDAFDPFGLSHHAMRDLLEEGRRRVSAPDWLGRVEDFLSAMIACSFEGIVSDPVSDPRCIEGGNVEAVSEAMSRLMTGATLGEEPAPALTRAS